MHELKWSRSTYNQTTFSGAHALAYFLLARPSYGKREIKWSGGREGTGEKRMKENISTEIY